MGEALQRCSEERSPQREGSTYNTREAPAGISRSGLGERSPATCACPAHQHLRGSPHVTGAPPAPNPSGTPAGESRPAGTPPLSFPFLPRSPAPRQQLLLLCTPLQPRAWPAKWPRGAEGEEEAGPAGR